MGTLSTDMQSKVCHFSITQPVFLFIIVLVWTLTCLRYMRKAVAFMCRLLIVPTVSSMAGNDVLRVEDGNTKVVVGLTCWIKFVFVAFVSIPLVSVNGILLWLGSRWLVATLSFAEIMLNAVALEFVLN